MAHDNGNHVPLGNDVTPEDKAYILDLLLVHLGAVGELENRMASPLEHAAKTDDVNLLRNLLTLGASANTVCWEGQSILHMVAHAGNQSAVLALLGHGAVVHAPGRGGRTALHLAALNDHALTAASLLAVGAEHVNFRCSEDELTALDVAACKGSVGVMKTLIRSGADVNASTSKGDTALHNAAARGQVGAIRVLLENGANVSAVTSKGLTALHTAASRDQVGAINALFLQGRADLNALDGPGRTPLHLATWGDKHRSVTALCALGADKDRLDGSGRPPLHYGINLGRRCSVVALLDAGADIELREHDNFQSSPLDVAAWGGDVEIVKTLLERGANVAAADPRGRTALHKAARCGENLTIDVLVAAGADVSAQTSGGQTPLHYAAWELRVNAARALLGHGASVDAPDDRRWSPLHVAASVCWGDNSMRLIRVLLERDADATAVDDQHRTPVGVLGIHAQEEPVVWHGLPNNAFVKDLLNRAPAERADRRWRRRSFPVMCRARRIKAQEKLRELSDGTSCQACDMENGRGAKLPRVEGGGGDVAGNVGGGGIVHQGAEERASVADDATEGLMARVLDTDHDLFKRVIKFL